jgi:hypothetical protein
MWGWKLAAVPESLCRDYCGTPHAPGLTKPRLINFAWSDALGVAVVPRHDRRKLEGLEWRLAALRSHRRLELAALLGSTPSSESPPDGRNNSAHTQT